MRSARLKFAVLLLVAAAIAGLVACSVTIESGEVSAFRHKPPSETATPSPSPWATPTPARG